MRISQLDSYRNSKHSHDFRDLPLDTRARAYRWLECFCRRWGSDLPPWRYAILVGQARRLALHPLDSAWGRTMLAKRGGLALQRKLRAEGKHPTAHATRCRVLKQNVRKRAVAEAELRSRLRLPPAERVSYLPLD
jgi:hypothetical protein